MGSHPVNLALRFILEMAALISVGVWGWKQSDSWLKFVLAFGVPILLAAIWGIFAVPDDPSRSGNATVITPGIVRLIIELGFFGIAAWAQYNAGYEKVAIGFAMVVILHYVVSYDRILWLLSN